MPSSDPNYPTAHPRFAVGSSPSTALGCAISAVLGLMMTLGAGSTAHAGDILRGGAPAGAGNRPSSASTTGANPAMTARARANANDALTRTTKALQSVRSMQDAARAAAIARPSNLGLSQKNGRPLPKVPNGLVVGGLQVAPGVPKDLLKPAPSEDRTLWTGANLPTQRTSGGETNVTIRQTKQTAVLNWKTFNIGKETTLTFDQGLGGSRKGEWIAFNKVNDPSGVPSQILGSIKADGQVYVINQNGIIFGGASQINTRTLVASTLPINDNLIQQGLLNNRDAQFLFSALPVPGGSDGTPAFNPTVTDPEFVPTAEALTYTFQEIVALTKTKTLVRTPDLTYRGTDGAKLKLVAGTDYTVNVDTTFIRGSVTFTPAGLAKLNGASVTATYTPHIAKSGNVVVQPGAILTSPVTGDGNGGRVMLVGANVTNAGTISTPAGQTILAAGLQVGIAAHASTDPSLRGLDVFVGAVQPGTGTATNSGLIESLTGSVSMTGREVNQLGAIESSTTVDLNGRIDLRASYGAVANPGFDGGDVTGTPIFFIQNTGAVTLGRGSVTRILPDYASESTVPGSALPQVSQMNIEGLAVHFGEDGSVLVPNGKISVRAGKWLYKDSDGDRTTFDAKGKVTRSELDPFLLSSGSQRLVYSGGQIYLDPNSLISVAGSTDVLVPIAQSILDVEFRGAELADSPLQRDGVLRSTALTVDLRRTGAYNGRFWMGTALGDVTGLAGLIQRNVSQLTTAGGTISFEAGGSIVTHPGSVLDVSGGSFQHEGGMVKTSRLLQEGRLVDIADARPDQIYDGVFTGKFVVTHAKYGISETYSVPFISAERFEPGYLEGAAGGALSVVAPSMAMDGELLGLTVQGPRDRSAPPTHSSLSIKFSAERSFTLPDNITLKFLTFSPTPPQIWFSNEQPASAPLPEFQLSDAGNSLPPERLRSVTLSSTLLSTSGFGVLTIENADGDIFIPAGVELSAPALGSISLAGTNIGISGKVTAPGGSLNFVSYNSSPAAAELFRLENPQAADGLVPAPKVGQGLFTLARGAILSTAGLTIDDRAGDRSEFAKPIVLNGGTIGITAYSAALGKSALIDVSGGVSVNARGAVSYGSGGKISVLTGKDPGCKSEDVLGGTLELGSNLQGYSGTRGGTLALQASTIQIGGAAAATPSTTLYLQPDFFRKGGFTRYELTGLGGLLDPGNPFVAAVPPGADGTPAQPAIPARPAIYSAGITIAPNTRIEPVAENWIVQPALDRFGEPSLTTFLRPVGLRTPVSISFAAPGSDDTVTTPLFVEVRGDISMGAGAQIVTDPGASVSFKAQTISLLGSVSAPGGSISVSGASRFPLGQQERADSTFARATVFLGAQARLSTAGTFVPLPDDPYGRSLGKVLPGGSIAISGNIVASKGAILDVSGTSAVLDLPPSQVANSALPTGSIPFDSGLTAPLFRLRSVPVEIHSRGGLIDLQGSEMLFSDATLLGHAGGPSAIGGTLSVFSGRFYTSDAIRTSADINLIVTQRGDVIPKTNSTLGVGLGVPEEAGIGYFSVDRFAKGGFHSLDLGAKYLNDASPPFGGNVEFRGPVSITAPGFLRVAGGGVLQASDSVSLSGTYVTIGQPFRPPLHPDDKAPAIFTQTGPALAADYFLAPLFGTGSLTVRGDYIDAGNLSLQKIGKTELIAHGGDIRGNGTLSAAGSITLRAAQIYPTTLATFDVFAHDKNVLVARSTQGQREVTLASPTLPPGFKVGASLLGSTITAISGRTVVLASGANAGIVTATPVSFAPGSVRIVGSGESATPLSAGGTLRIFASRIVQGGTLRAPLGSIVLGWDGTDFDPSDADIDQPIDSIAGSTLPALTTKLVTLRAGSLTSVTARNPTSEAELVIPFGLSSDGLSWIDPRGVNITISGLPQKTVSITGNTVATEAGSTIDIQGGGDLSAFRWVPGPGGSVDILGEASASWTEAATYEPGDLVSSAGQTWAARVGSRGQRPTVSLFWSLVPESYAILPDFASSVFPYAPFNADADSGALLGGDLGYVSKSLKVGDRIFLNETAGLSGGFHTLLPRRYALLPGAFLVTPNSSSSLGTFVLPDGATHVSGYSFNQLSKPEATSGVQTRFEVASSEVFRSRAQYDDYAGNSFFTKAADRLDIEQVQRLPIDAGYLALHGNSGLRLEGSVYTGRPSEGRGAAIDVSSFADIYISDTGTAPRTAQAGIVLDTDILESWGAESLLIGGLRRQGSAGTTIDVRTSNLLVDSPGGFTGPEITLASRAGLTLTAGSILSSIGSLSEPASRFLLSGDGALLRVSADPAATISRTNVTDSTAPLLVIGANARIAGTSVTIDSTYGTRLHPSATLQADALTLGSGQISILLDGPREVLEGSLVDPHLTIAGKFLSDVEQVRSLTLRSYRSVDFYGEGTFGGKAIEYLTVFSSGIRGFDHGTESVALRAGSILFSNPSNVAAVAAPGTSGGQFDVRAGTVRLGKNAFSATGFSEVEVSASHQLLGQGATREGGTRNAFTTPGNLTIITPVITGLGGTTHDITAGGILTLERRGNNRGSGAGLGSSFTFTGAEVLANTHVLLPSGQITLRATSGDVSVGGDLDVAGTKKKFFDLTRYADAGTITFTADAGNVALLAGSTVSVAAPTGGGNAGTLTVQAPQGIFSITDAELSGRASAGHRSGSFILDVGTLPSFSDLSGALNNGGFFEQRNFRVRLGDLLIADVDGEANVARNFTVSADVGNIRVTGTIGARGATGGKIVLVAGGNLTLENGAVLDASADDFSNAGKGGEIRLEAGSAVAGTVLDIQSGSRIDLGVETFQPGLYTNPESSAFRGQFTGTLHLRAPRTADDVNVEAILGDVVGASSVLVEGYKTYNQTDGRLNIALRNQIHAENTAYITANYAAMESKLLGGSTLDSNMLVIAPGVEIINRTGSLTLGVANSTPAGSANAEARSTADWDLSGFRYGPKEAPGVLTLRASGDLVFNNTLSDGFNPVAASAQNGHSSMWLGHMMDLKSTLPANTQSWSYRLAAGSDLQAADFRAVVPNAGSLLVGEFYPAVPNTLSSGASAGIGGGGLTANTIRISQNAANDRGTRYEVVRTGTGTIDIAAGGDVRLRNQFATIYTAGARLPNPTTIFTQDDFVVPSVEQSGNLHPSQGAALGAPQQIYRPQWALSGGSVTISANGDIGRFTLLDNEVIPDASRQMPNNWLYRRGYVDSATGLFAAGGVEAGLGTVQDPSASTTWWVDYSNFFQGFGALGGGDITLTAGTDLVNADAVIPTNARMPGRIRNADLTFSNLPPDPTKLVELGGGDLVLRAGNNVDGGVFYVERGVGSISAGGRIKTNAARSPSSGILQSDNVIADPLTWLPTTLFAGKSQFTVSARGDVLLGPVANTFLLPQGLNNKFWYKTYFNTYSPNASVESSSFGGSVTHRLAVEQTPILQNWYSQYSPIDVTLDKPAEYQPWIRLAETGSDGFATIFTVTVPTVRSTAFAGDVNIVGSMTLFPSRIGTLELAASGGIVGLQRSGASVFSDSRPATVWTSATVNVSDSDPRSTPSIASPLAYSSLVGRNLANSQTSSAPIFSKVDPLFKETGSFTGINGAIQVQQALHAQPLLHSGDREPIRIYATGGDVTGLTLFSPKVTRIVAQNDITDVAFYLQNVDATDISLVSAGRDIIPFNENSALRSIANDATLGNRIGDTGLSTVSGSSTNAQAGDIQINGPGAVVVLAGRNLDLGTGSNFTDGTGVGITSIGNARNPFLSLIGADIVALAGVSDVDGSGPALGLSRSTLAIETFLGAYPFEVGNDSYYLTKMGTDAAFEDLDEEQRALVALESFFDVLRESGREASAGGDYTAGYAAIQTMFGGTSAEGEILTRAREIRTTSDGAISILAPGGGVTMASDIFGNPLTPPGIVTASGGPISVFTDGSVDIGQARIFTLRGGDIIMWSTNGNIAAGNAPRTVATAPPTRVVINATSASVQTDLGGLATGGGIGVLASVKNVAPGNVDLIAPVGFVDAGDAGIRVTGNLNIAATAVLNAGSIQVAGNSAGVPAAAPAAAPVVTTSAPPPPQNNAPSAAEEEEKKRREKAEEETPSIIVVEVIGYGGE